jgi:hypothetical protein
VSPGISLKSNTESTLPYTAENIFYIKVLKIFQYFSSFSSDILFVGIKKEEKYHIKEKSY